MNSASTDQQIDVTVPKVVRHPVASRIERQAHLLTFRMTVLRRINTGKEIDPYVVEWTDDVPKATTPSAIPGVIANSDLARLLVGDGVEIDPLAWLKKTLNPFSKTVPDREAPLPYRTPHPPQAFVSFVEQSVDAVAALEDELVALRQKCSDLEDKLKVMEFAAAEANKVPEVETINTASIPLPILPDEVEREFQNFLEGSSLLPLLPSGAYNHMLADLRKMPQKSRALALSVVENVLPHVQKVSTGHAPLPWFCDLNADRFSVAGVTVSDTVAFLNASGLFRFELLHRAGESREKFVRAYPANTTQLIG